MSNLFDNSNSFAIDRYPNIYSSVSVGGRARVERAGLSFYYVSSFLPIMYEEKFKTIDTELMGIQDGVGFLTTTIPHDHTYFRGSWAGTPVISSSSGRSVSMTGFTNNAKGVAMAGDWIQFSNGTKVYQIVNTVNASSTGTATITVHTDFVAQPSSTTTITRGEDVQFKLLLTDKPGWVSIPGRAGVPLYEFTGPFVFREVL